MDNLLTASECLTRYGLNWNVLKVPIYDNEGREIENYRAIKREDTGSIFQISGAGYEPVQNLEAFNFFDEVVGTGFAKYESAGSYKDGAVVWIKARVPYDFEPLPGDELTTYFRLTTSHDGSQKLSVMPYVFRQVCSNGLTAEAIDYKRIIAVKHTENLRLRFTINAKEMFKAQAEYFKAFAERCRELSKKQMTSLQIDQFLCELFNAKGEGKDSTRLTNQIEEVRRLHETGKGSNIPGVRGTAWGVYNAVTEYVDHYRSTKGDDDNREFSSVFGSGSAVREKAFALLRR